MNIREYQDLSKKIKKPRKQIEGAHQRNLGDLLNGRLRRRINPNLIFWTYSSSGEKKSLKTAVLQKRKGLQKGDFDYRFEIKDGDILRIVYLETKSETGSLTFEQKLFMRRKEGLKNVKCYTSSSIAKTLEILEGEKILLGT